jgi:EpsI family protein
MQPRDSWRRFLSVALLLGASVVLLEARGTTEVLPPHKHLVEFPADVREWHGSDVPLTQDTLDVLGPGEFLSRDYRQSSFEPPVGLFIAYFPSQRTGDTIHSPKNCLPGSGWVPLKSDHIALQRQDGSSFEVNRYWIGKGTDQNVVLYWYQAHGRVTPSEYWAKVFLVSDAITLNRTDGALVRVVSPITDKNDDGGAQARATAFAEQVTPLLDTYIPR